MTGEDVLTISQMCDAFGVTPRTLGFYEARGLLAPLRAGRNRLYTRRERGRLKLILRGRRFGFSLDEICDLLNLYEPGGENSEQLRAIIDRARIRLSEMRTQQRELNELIEALEVQVRETTEFLGQMAEPTSHQDVKDDR